FDGVHPERLDDGSETGISHASKLTPGRWRRGFEPSSGGSQYSGLFDASPPHVPQGSWCAQGSWVRMRFIVMMFSLTSGELTCCASVYQLSMMLSTGLTS